MTRFFLRRRPVGSPRLVLAAGILASSCALPPQNEEVPVTAELESAPRPSATQRTQPTAPDEGVVEPESSLRSTDSVEEDPSAATRAVTPSSGQVVDERPVAQSPSGPREPSAARLDLEAIDRDVGAELPRGAEADLVPQAIAAPPSSPEESGEAPGENGRIVASELVPEDVGFETVEIETAEGRLMSYRVGGTGPPVILIHGWCGAGRQWDATARELAGTQRVFVVDLPGHGNSVTPVRLESKIPIFGRDVARLIEARELDDVVLVGHAMGAQIALETAAQLPGRVLAIVGVDALQTISVDPDPALIAPYAEQFATDFERSMRDFIDQAVDPSTPETIRAGILDDARECRADVVALMRHFGEHDPKPAIRTIDCRVYCINSRSAPTDVDGNRLLLPGFEVAYVDQAGHWPHLEKSEAFLERLQRELRRIAPRPGDGAPPRIVSMSPVIYCDNVLEVRDFYVEGLAFEEEERSPRDPEREPDFVALRRDGVTLIVQESRTILRDLPNVPAAPRDLPLFLLVTNLDRELARLDDVEIVVPERRLAGGARIVILKDPAGTLVYLQQPAVERTQR